MGAMHGTLRRFPLSFRRFALLICTLALCAPAVAQEAFPDVAEEHWAAEAVLRLADLGIVMGFPDGTFRGEEGFSRFQAALVVDRLLRVVGDEVTALEEALSNDVQALGGAVNALASEAATLRREVATNRAAVEALHEEVARLRQELDLPPPAPLPGMAAEDADARGGAADVVPVVPVAPEAADLEPPEPEEPESGDAGEPDGGGGDAAADRPDLPMAEPSLEPADEGEPMAAPGAETDPADALDGAAEDEVPPLLDASDAEAELAQADGAPAIALAPRMYAGLAVGTSNPAGVILRTIVGVEDLFADRFGARLAVDLGRRSATPLGSVTVLGHATYRLVDETPFGAYAGLGLGYRFAGEGLLASALGGGTWRAFAPVDLFAEATLDIYLQRGLPPGATRFAPGLVVGARWNF